jgi:hypothetical protein
VKSQLELDALNTFVANSIVWSYLSTLPQASRYETDYVRNITPGKNIYGVERVRWKHRIHGTGVIELPDGAPASGTPTDG